MAALKKFALGLLAFGMLATAAPAGVMYAPTYHADALLDMGHGAYHEENNLTAGGARPWWESPVVQQVYGGTPDSVQRWQFTAAVFHRTEAAFHRSGLPLELTLGKGDPVPHAMSVVSNTYSPYGPGAVGMTTLGGSGFTFIDGLRWARNADDLATAVAHNVAHELIHAFGGGHYDTTGKYLDAAVVDWETLIDPNARFSPSAVADMLPRNFRSFGGGMFWPSFNSMGFFGAGHVHGPACTNCMGMQVAAPVPEPATLGLWGLALVGGLWARRRSARRAA